MINWEIRHKKIKSALKRIHDYLVQADMLDKVFMTGGALLGQIRDGDLIKNDNDIDLGIMDVNVDKLKELNDIIIDDGHKISAMFYNQAGDFTEVSYVIDSVKIEFFVHFTKGWSVEWYAYWKEWESKRSIKSRLVKKLEIIEICGVEFYKPIDHTEYLSCVYGDWETPIENWSYTEDCPASTGLYRANYTFVKYPTDFNIASKKDSNITAVIKAFERPQCVDRLLKSMKKYYPLLPIIIADDSKNPEPRTDCEWYKLPYDTGLSAGRNFLVSKVKTEYFLLLDDDFIFTENTNVDELMRVIQKYKLDIVGGDVCNHGHSLDFHGTITYKDGGVYADSGYLEKNEDYETCQFVHNFFVAKTSKIKKYKWEDTLKVGEHIAYFTEHYKSLKIGYIPEIKIEHDKPAVGKEYRSMRGRAHVMFQGYFYDKFNVNFYMSPYGKKYMPLKIKEANRIIEIAHKKNDTVVHKKNDLPKSTTSMILGCGTGRCGTKSLSALIDGCDGITAKHEGRPLLPWKFNMQTLCDKIKLFNNGLTADVCLSWLPYCEYMLANFSNAKVICIERDTKKVIPSFKEKLQGGGRFSNHFTKKGRNDFPEWIPCFPKYSTNFDAALLTYINYYKQRIQEIKAVYKRRVMIIDIDALNTREGQRKIFDFIGVNERRRKYYNHRLNVLCER